MAGFLFGAAVGLFVGFLLGVFVMALMAAAHRGDEMADGAPGWRKV